MSRLDHLGAACVVGFMVGIYAPALVARLRDRRLRRRYTGSTCRVLTELPPRFETRSEHAQRCDAPHWTRDPSPRRRAS